MARITIEEEAVAEVTAYAVLGYEYLDNCIRKLEAYKEQLDGMESKYLDHNMDDLNTLIKETKQLQKSVTHIGEVTAEVLENMITQDSMIS